LQPHNTLNPRKGTPRQAYLDTTPKTQHNTTQHTKHHDNVNRVQRAPRDYEASRITKPARCSFNAPFDRSTAAGAFVAQVAGLFPSTAAKLIVTSGGGGAEALAAAGALATAGYSSVVVMEGGYDGYSQVGGAFWLPVGPQR